MSAPVLEARNAEELAAALGARVPGFLPGWRAEPGGPGAALLEVYGSFLRTLAERIDAAPDKNELAFLDLLGLDVLPAGAARAPVVLSSGGGGGDGRAPARTRLGAKGPDPARPLVFETETAIALTQARLTEVVTLWPGRDAYADHSADAIGGRPFTLWEGLQPVAHELYLAHELHFALSGQSSVALQVELAPAGGRALELEWSWWDGEAWRAFKEPEDQDVAGASFDRTLGLTRNGTIRLETDCGKSKRRAVGGWNAHWLRARTRRSLVADASRRLPEIDRISVRTVIDRRLPADDCGSGAFPDRAFAGGEQLDPTKPFFPLGRAPAPDVAFYLSWEEAFSKPGAQVEICFDRPQTAQEKADEEQEQYAADVTSAVKHVVDAAKQVSLALQKAAAAIIGMAPQNDAGAATASGQVTALQTATNALVDMSGLDAVVTAATQLTGSLAAISITIANLTQTDVDEQATIARIQAAADHAAEAARQSNANMEGFLEFIDDFLGGLLGIIDKASELDPAAKAVREAAQVIESLGDTGISGPITTISSSITRSEWWDFDGDSQAIVDQLDTVGYSVGPAYKTVQVPDAAKLVAGRQTARARASEAAAAGRQGLVELNKLDPLQAALAAGKTPPKLDPPVLVWEYWDGSAWRKLYSDATEDAANLMASGRIAFTVRDDWEPSEVNGTEARWLRARIDSGVYGRLTLVSWKDEDHQVHFMTIIEPRPPQLDALFLGYYFESAPATPQHCLTRNDFRWEDHTGDAAWRGGTFTPFRPVEDATPALYLGYDRPLPALDLGILLDLEEADGVESGPALRWERWDGAGWQRLAVGDETEGLAVPGIVSVPWPGGPVPEPATVASASGQEVRLADARSAERFAAGEVVWLEDDGKSELATVAGVAGEVVHTTAPLASDHRQATLVRAGLPRFGTPRTWLRARLRSDGEPLRARVRGVHPNAGWAAQVETVEDELLGGGNGEPRQAFFLTRTPVLSGELIEVRELEGGRAHVEYPLLVKALRAAGIAEDDLRVVRDSRTGHVTEVWVPWRRRPTLAFSGPDDRDYTLERTRGRVLFGDGVHGRIPPAGADNARARRYRSGGGTEGNVAPGAIAQVLSGALVAAVANPVRAEGGAASESDAAVLARGPLAVRHRRQALTAADYEALAREASPGVAVARASARRGGVTVAIVPYSSDPAPAPSWTLRRAVRDFLRARAPAALGGAVSVVAPRYALVGVSAVVVARSPGVGGPLVADASEALRRFLHPLTGGPGGAGWPFGRRVHLSDVAARLEGLDGLDHVEELVLVVDGAPQGESASVPPDRLVAAGPIDVELGGGDR